MQPVDSILEKIIPSDKLEQVLARWHLKGHQIIFTNGVFDILHRGHITLLAEAASLGHHLIVGLNSDNSVKMLGKGPGRPVNTQDDRAFVLAGLTSVAAVVVFEEATPFELIRLIEPDVLVKGGDYDPHQTDQSAKDFVVGSDLQSAGGRETVTIDLVAGYSTTAIIKRSTNG